MYAQHGSEGDDQARLSVIQSTLGRLPLTNIATLDAITTHFTRLIELTSADEAFVSTLAHLLTNCILRPRVESSLTQHERHSYRLIRDLFAHKEQIFGELKRASTLASSGGRMRAVSTDESKRRTNIEARNRAVITAAKSRSSSPAPPAHRKGDSGSTVTRFPISVNPGTTTSPTAGSPRNSGKFKQQRESLEVPSSLAKVDQDLETTESPVTSDGDTPPASAVEPAAGGLGRTGRAVGARFPRNSTGLVRNAVDRKRDSIASSGSVDSATDSEPAAAPSHGVTLTDRPMDD